MAPSARNPSTWDEYEGRASPVGSFTSNAITEDQAVDDTGDDEPHNFLERRRSSVTNRLAAMADIGGVNSFRSFARSWQRAAGFPEVIPRRPSFVFAHDGSAIDNPSTEDIEYPRSNYDERPAPAQRSLLRQHLENSPPSSSLPNTGRQHSASDASAAVGAGEPSASFSSAAGGDETKQLLDPEMAASGALLSGSPSSRSSIFANPPHLATNSIIGSYGSYRSSLYGTTGSGPHRPPRLSIGRGEDAGAAPGGAGEESETEEDAAHGEHEPILVKEVKQGNKVVLTVEGQSTLPQSVFNSINAIIGIGILSLPLAIKLSGWIIGLILLTLTATVTAYTGRLLARCMDYDPSLITYSDLAYVSFGTQARIVVSALFSLELVAANVALMILFADSLYLLLPGVATVNIWKCVCAVLVLALNAVPLRFLSYTSIIGILSTFCIILIVLVDGLVKEHTPGSLWEPATTYLLPSNWLALPLAYGLLASPWGAHSIFPSIYRDMRHPAKWGKAVKITFSFSYVLDTCLAVIGILMFGDGISDAITSDVLATKGFPQALTIIMCVFVAIIPLTKMPLNARPLVTTAEVLLGLHEISNSHHHHPHHPVASRRSIVLRSLARVSIRVVNVLVLLLISIAFPAFDSVCAFLGAALCTLVSIVLPLSFYLKLYWTEIPPREKIRAWLILVVFSIFGLIGTVWTFLPKHLIGQ